MKYKNEDKFDIALYESLRNDCKKCFGFCCVALYFSASEGFPTNKDAGKPCLNLKGDFSCAIHKNLRKKGLKGCTAYDCFGAGQKVAQVTYGGHDWLQAKDSSKQMFETFLIMKKLHEMLWYLAEALRIQKNNNVKDELSSMIHETERITSLSADSLMEFDLEAYRDNVNSLLKQTSELVRAKVLKEKQTTSKHNKTIAGRLNFMGKDLRKTNLRGADLSGALLIAADLRGNDLIYVDFIGADLRDADIRGANLTDSIFITQSQINTAKGDSNTKLPISLVPPEYWDK